MKMMHYEFQIYKHDDVFTMGDVHIGPSVFNP